MSKTSPTVQIWKSIKDINLVQEKVNIFYDPKTFFEKYLEKIPDTTVKKTIRVEIYLILRKISEMTNNPEDDEQIAIKCGNDVAFVKVCRQFYAYTLSLLTTLLAEQIDAILDAYNEKKIDKRCMENYITVFKKTETGLLAEKKQLQQRIMELDILLEEIGKNPNLLDDFRNSL